MASTSALCQGALRASRLQATSRAQSVRVVAATTIEFIKGVKESSVPDVKLTRSRDGSSGTAIFYFENPDVFEVQSDGQGGDITGMYLSDEEGTLQTVSAHVRRRPRRVLSDNVSLTVAPRSRWTCRRASLTASRRGSRPSAAPPSPNSLLPRSFAPHAFLCQHRAPIRHSEPACDAQEEALSPCLCLALGAP